MNITPQAYTLPIQTAVNLQTDSLRRDNQQREVIAKPEAANQSAGEKGVASDKERGRTPAQNNEQLDFASLRKQAEQASESINGDSRGNDGSPQDPQQDSSQDSSNENGEQNSAGAESTEGNETSAGEQKSDAQVFAETQEIRSLESRDKEVRTHEMAHATVGGAFTGSPSYSFEIGPNGKKYAVEGEVSVDLTPVAGDPQETIAKMKRVQAAALAPASPSSQDVRVAASAASIILEAQAELVAASADNTESKPEIGNLYLDKEVLAQDDDSFENNESSKAFDHQMQQTLSSQEAIAPSRASAVDERAGRIEQFYSTINHAYEKPPSHQFELTA